MTDKEKLDLLLMDWADDDTRIRELAKPYLSDFEINGDRMGVPTVVDIVEKLCGLLKHKTENKP